MEYSHHLHENNCTLYPGEYIPMLDNLELQEELLKIPDEHVSRPVVNVLEENECFRIEAALPGLKREDFFVTIQNNILSITVLHKHGSPDASFLESARLREFNYDCFNRHIVLPDQVETEFVRAEYKDGILFIYLPKTETCRNSSSCTHVIVY